MDKFTYIIPHRASTDDRKNNLNTLIKYLREIFTNIEIIVVEQDRISRICDFVKNNTKNIFLFNNGLFNKSWALNIGAKYSSHNILVMGDSDVIVDYNYIQEGISHLTDYDVISPYEKIFDLDKFDSDTFHSNLTNLSFNKNERLGINFCGGMVIFKKEKFFSIGGWDEIMEGWGGEDDLMTFKVNNFLKHKVLEHYGLHLYHVRLSGHDDYFNCNYKNNLSHLAFLRNMSKEILKEYCYESQRWIGMKNKKISYPQIRLIKRSYIKKANQ